MSWPDLIVPGLVLIACLLVAVALGATLRGRAGARRATVAVAPAVSRPAPRVATAKALLALPEAPIHLADLTDLTDRTVLPPDDQPTGSFPRVTGTGGFPARSSDAAPSTTGGFPTAGRTSATGGFPSPRTPGRGVPYPNVPLDDVSPRITDPRITDPRITDTGPRHAVRR